MKTQDMTNDDYARTLDGLDRLPNDPDVPIRPALIWRLVEEVLEHDLQPALCGCTGPGFTPDGRGGRLGGGTFGQREFWGFRPSISASFDSK